jgi:hypothetical protein
MLFNSITELREYVNVSEGLNFETIAPDIARTESQVLRRYLGAMQYDELNIEYRQNIEDITDMEGRLKDLLLQVRPAVALLSVLNSAGILSLQISDSGFQMMSSDTYKQAFAWMKNDAKAYLAQFGYVMIDEMLYFLETNKDDYPLWVADSKAYTLNKQFIVPDSSIFNQSLNINDSRLTFMALQPMMNRVEAFKIAPSISAAFYASIKEEIKTGTISEDTQAIMVYLQPAIVFFTAAKSLFELPLQITENGILMNYARAFESQQNKETKVADTVDRRKVADQWEQDGANYLSMLVDYLNDNATASKYASFFNSTIFKGTGQRSEPYTNNPESRIFGMF